METPRILIVEDEVITAFHIEGLLKLFGYQVAGTAAAGEEAVVMARELSPDLILMDIVLDGKMSGIEAAGEIQRTEDIPVVYLTANADQVTVLKARETNPFGYIVKPVNEKELFSNIDTALQKQKLLKQIRDSEERYRTVIENSYDGILVIRDGVVLYANPRFCRITGYECEYCIGKPISFLLHGDDRERVVQNYLKRFEGGSVDDAYSFRIHTASGQLRWFELHAVPVTWEGAGSLLVFLNDITESREAGDTIRRYAHDLGERVKELRCLNLVSRYLSEHTGPIDDLIPRILRSLQEAMQYPESTCAVMTLHGIRYETENFSETPWRIAGDVPVGGASAGSIELYYLEERPGGFVREEAELLNETGLQLGGFLRRRRLEEERELLSLVVESSDDAIISESLEGIVWSWNRGAERMYGYSAEEMIGSSIYRIIPPSYNEKIAEILDRIGLGQRIEHYETQRVHRDGRLLNVSLTFSPVVDRRGVIIGASAITRDITEQRKLERGLVEAGLRERRELGYSLHDNLGQVLTGASFMTEALRKMLNDKHPEGSAQAAEIQQIINQAIELTRMVSRGLVPVDLMENSLEDALLKLAETSREMYGISCGTVIEPDFRIGDPLVATELYYIAQEALRNAVTHGKAKRVDIILRQNSERLALVVQDNGTGIQKDDDASPGIGMKIMEYRARFVGGWLSVISRREGGMIVICTVPSVEHEK
ncbi:MAG TPA: PAS domain S-box protein [Spirochaetota bacterium]|nr:PAS domain S-box protein [Spirochaetota bacterium]